MPIDLLRGLGGIKADRGVDALGAQQRHHPVEGQGPGAHLDAQGTIDRPEQIKIEAAAVRIGLPFPFMGGHVDRLRLDLSNDRGAAVCGAEHQQSQAQRVTGCVLDEDGDKA